MRPMRIAVGRLVLVVLAAWAIGTIVPSFYQVARPLASFGLSTDDDGVLIDLVAPFARAEDSPATRAGLALGERIDLQAMRCVPPGTRRCAALLSVLGGLGGIQYVRPGSEIELVVISADGRARRNVRLAATEVYDDWLVIAVLALDTIVGIVFIGAAFLLVWTRPSRMTWGFFLYAVWFNPGQTFAYYAMLQPWPLAILVQEALEALAQGAALAGLLTFALRFPDDRLEARWRRLDAVLPLFGVLVTLLAAASYGNAFGFGTETLTRVVLLCGYGVSATVLAILLIRRRSLDPLDDQRMRWVIAGAAIGLPAFILAEISQTSGLLTDFWGGTGSQVVVGLLYLVNGVLAYFVSVAVKRRRVVSLAIPLRRGSILSVLTLAVGVPVVYLHQWLGAYQQNLHLPGWIWPVLVAPIVLLVLRRLNEKLVELVEHVFNRGYHRARGRLEQAGEAMLHASSLGEIDQLLVAEPVAALRLASGAVFRRENGEVRMAGHTIGWDGAAGAELSLDSDSPLRRAIAAGRPVRLARGGRERPGLPPGVGAPCLAVPASDPARKPIAVALYGAHETGTDINADERELLNGLAKRAAAVYARIETDLLRREVAELRGHLAPGDRAAPRPEDARV